MARTNLSVDRKVFDEFAAQADRRNMTLFAFANESLTSVAKIASEGGDPSQIYRIWKVLSLLRQADVITLPSDFVEGLIKEIYLVDSESCKTRFRELGSSVVGLLKLAAENIEDLASLAKDFGFIIPIKHFGMTDTQNGTIQVDVAGAGKGIETTECSSEFLKSVLKGYGYETTKEDLHTGVIRLTAQKGNGWK